MLFFRNEPVGHQEKWMNFLWIFLSMFLNSGQDAATLLGLYRQCLKNERKVKQHQIIDIECT